MCLWNTRVKLCFLRQGKTQCHEFSTAQACSQARRYGELALHLAAGPRLSRLLRMNWCEFP